MQRYIYVVYPSTRITYTDQTTGGTVGAAREAACKGLPSIAFSLDNYKARSEEQYQAAATYALVIIKACLGILPCSPSRPLRAFANHVINVNIPGGTLEDIKGLHICHQGQHCNFPDFREVETDPHFFKNNGGSGGENAQQHKGEVTIRAYKNAAGYLQEDLSEGSDSWAVSNGWVAVTVVGLCSDVPLTLAAAERKVQTGLGEAVSLVVKSSAEHLNVECAGIPDEFL